MTAPRVLMTGISFGESLRWHDGRLWFSDWAGQTIHALDPDGTSEVIATIESFPFCIDFLPDGRTERSSGSPTAWCSPTAWS